MIAAPMLAEMLAEVLADAPSPWLQVFGRAHPVLLHSPLGLVPALLLLEFGAALLRKEPPRGAILAVAWLCALSSAAAAASGWVLADSGDYTGDTVDQHKVLGIAFGALCVLAAPLASLRDRRALRVVLLLAGAVMVPAGHLGGTLTHGRDFLFAPLTERPAPTPPAPTPTAPAPTAPAPTAPGNGTASPSTSFAATIAPILERTCTSCHNPEKTKGELLLTTTEGIAAGGENGAVIVPGKPDDSPLLTRCLLPLDHDDHMPPEGKPQPTAEELEALRAWIAAGARFD